jgi:nucleotide-binding universal stress UspA family protein
MRNIMVATDGSEGAKRAVDVAIELAKGPGRTLSVVTVAIPLSAKEQREFARIEGDEADPSETLAQRNLHDARRQAEQAGIKPATKLAWGDPAEAIIKTIEREKVDAVVVGRRGHGQLAGLLLGSVSQKLCSLAPCAVIVVP